MLRLRFLQQAWFAPLFYSPAVNDERSTLCACTMAGTERNCPGSIQIPQHCGRISKRFQRRNEASAVGHLKLGSYADAPVLILTRIVAQPTTAVMIDSIDVAHSRTAPLGMNFFDEHGRRAGGEGEARRCLHLLVWVLRAFQRFHL